MTRDEFWSGLRIVGPITLATVAVTCGIITLVLALTDFSNAKMHYTLATLFPLILCPATVFPFVLTSQRLRHIKAELEALVRTDTLTGLPNRLAFFEQAQESFGREGPVALIMIDVDHFKSVNDRLGHAVGDTVLRTVAGSLADIVTSLQRVDRKVFVARIGGEEFAMVFESDEADAIAAAAQIVERMRIPARASGRLIPITVSVGVAARMPSDSPDTVLRAADVACYRAKRLGRDRWCASHFRLDGSPREADAASASVLRPLETTI